MLQNIKSRGVKQVLLFASDGLEGMRDAVKRQFPDADHQQCWVHLSRTVCRYIRNKDRKEVLGDLKRVYRAESEEEAKAALQEFRDKHEKQYPKLAGIFERAKGSLFKFYKFPEAIRKAYSGQLNAYRHALEVLFHRQVDAYAWSFHNNCSVMIDPEQ